MEVMETSTFQHESVSLEGKEEEDDALPYLPDDVLVEVFKSLSVPELLAARLVCRRWAALALHADVWRHRDVDDRPERVLGATLNLAPCVQELSFSDLQMCSEALAKVAATTRCAAKKLYVCHYNEVSFGDDGDDDDDDDGDAAMTLVSIMKNQEQLGRLRELFLDISMESLNKAPLKALIPTACAIEGLTELTVRSTSDAVLEPEWLPPLRPRASLKKLTLDLLNASVVPDLLHLTIGCHAETLEFLSFRGPINNRLERAYRPKAELVAKAAGLRQLKCPLLRGMADLARCDVLESLTLELGADSTDDAVLDETEEYLRTATQVKRLTVEECELALGAEVLSMAVDLVEAVASSGRSELQVLTFSPFWSSLPADGELPDRLTAALGLLPVLRELRVDAERVFEFETILPLLECASRSAGAGPLTLRVQWDQLVFCLHAWVHEEAARLQRLFDARPGLHLEFDLYRLSHRRNRRAVFQCGKYRCLPCVRGCHADVGAESRVAFHGHAEADAGADQDGDGRCDAALHVDPGVRCYRLPPAPRFLRQATSGGPGGRYSSRYRL